MQRQRKNMEIEDELLINLAIIDCGDAVCNPDDFGRPVTAIRSDIR
jgi:hypothetical protein